MCSHTYYGVVFVRHQTPVTIQLAVSWRCSDGCTNLVYVVFSNFIISCFEYTSFFYFDCFRFCSNFLLSRFYPDFDFSGCCRFVVSDFFSPTVLSDTTVQPKQKTRHFGLERFLTRVCCDAYIGQPRTS